MARPTRQEIAAWFKQEVARISVEGSASDQVAIGAGQRLLDATGFSVIDRLRPDELGAMQDAIIAAYLDMPEPERAYYDPRKPLRACDRCERDYKGPAVYCSLRCAKADA